MKLPDLPVVKVLDALREALRHGHAVLEAPTGAGKTTLVPLALLGAGWLAGQRIVMLQPRRIAVRAAARRIAALLGEAVGKTVGFRTRLDSRTGPDTRIEVVTEGILTRMLQSDPMLDGIGIVIFDEFHERSIAADLGLALCLDVQSGLREDLRLIVMSATLDTARVADYLGGAAVVRSHGRTFPVAIDYRPVPARTSLDAAVASAVRHALTNHAGDLLVFLPGVHEINRVTRRLEALGEAQFDVLPLHGTLPDAAQDRALTPATGATRRVVLSTPIAETSLTIEGIRIVIDSGLARAPTFSPATGLSTLQTVRISRASAEQRSGRAGRVADGHCYRLWSRAEHARLTESYPAQIADADLAPLMLELATWGATDPTSLAWLDPPPAAPAAAARELLHALNAIDGNGLVTAHGRQMVALGLHPRLTHMLLKARELDAEHLACNIAALLSERDPLRFEAGHDDADIGLRLEQLGAGAAPLPRGASVSGATLRHIRATAAQMRRRLGAGRSSSEAVDPGILVALAWPDRIAVQREPGSLGYRLANGRGVALKARQPLMNTRILAVASVGGDQADGRIHLAAALPEAALDRHFDALISVRDRIVWDPKSRAVLAVSERRLDKAVLATRSISNPDPAALVAALTDGIRQSGLPVLPWSDAAISLRDRLRFLRAVGELTRRQWPDMGDSALLDDLERWLGPYLTGMSRATHLARLDLAAALKHCLDWQARQAMDRLAPVRLQIPAGPSLRLDYDVNLDAGETPVLAVRIQQMFGVTQTPRIVDGQVPVTLHLLSPAGRPVQITRDLASFWSGAYHEVRKDLKGRYPKHDWPADGLAATPSSGPRRRR